MGKFTISKQFSFDAAHRLIDGYQGKCAHLHGHTYTVIITIEKDSLDSYGMAHDFNDLKDLKDWIDQNLDHATLVNVRDDSLRDWLLKYKQRMCVFDDNPTAENIARDLFRIASDFFDIPVSNVEVFETKTCSASYGESCI
jgi:6-pyruvoyltetrahydropterin/6-carboxytetrahydropterin synthase